MRLRKSALIVGAVLAVLATAVWTLSPLVGSPDAARIAGAAVAVRDWPAAPLVVVAAFVVAELIATPASLLIVATIALFGPWRGVLLSEAGLFASGGILWAVGRHAARDAVARWLAARADPRLARLDAQLTRGGAIAVALLRMSPLPFALLSVAFGASGVRYRDFAFGTAIGVAPFLLLMAGLAHGVDAWMAQPDVGRAALLAAALGAIAALLWWIGRRVSRRP